MSEDFPAQLPPGEPPDEPRPQTRLLTLAEASSETGLSVKALARRVERGTLRSVHDNQGRRVVPRAELDRAGLFDGDHRGSTPGEPSVAAGEIVLLRELLEREREDCERLATREREVHNQLVAIANAGPIRAMRLRRQVRRQLEPTAKSTTST